MELRWLVKEVPCDWNPDGAVIAVREIKVLQYRAKLNQPAARGWTEWIDVPEVSDGFKVSTQNN